MSSGNREHAVSPLNNATWRNGDEVVQQQAANGASMKVIDESAVKLGPNLNNMHELVEPVIPEEDYGGELPKAMKAPTPPSRQEVLEHRILHCLFRAWCPECVAGKSKCSPHMSSGKESEQLVPVVAFDYAFMGDKKRRARTQRKFGGEIPVEDTGGKRQEIQGLQCHVGATKGSGSRRVCDKEGSQIH